MLPLLHGCDPRAQIARRTAAAENMGGQIPVSDVSARLPLLCHFPLRADAGPVNRLQGLQRVPRF